MILGVIIILLSGILVITLSAFQHFEGGLLSVNMDLIPHCMSSCKFSNPCLTPHKTRLENLNLMAFVVADVVPLPVSARELLAKLVQSQEPPSPEDAEPGSGSDEMQE